MTDDLDNPTNAGDESVADTAAPEAASPEGADVLGAPAPARDDAADIAAVFGATTATSEDAPAPEEALPVGDADVSAPAATESDEDPGSGDEPEVIDAEDLVVESARPPRKSPYDRPGKWYVIHSYAGYEKKVQQNLAARAQSMNVENKIHEVVIPEEEVTEFRAGKKVNKKQKVFPGYLLIRCRLDDESWYVIRNTPGVTGFVGTGGKPTPLRRREVESFLTEPDETTEAATASKRARPKMEYEMGETVRVKEGAFADFSGEIVEINEVQLRLKVLVNIFGRETPVELDFTEVAKL